MNKKGLWIILVVILLLAWRIVLPIVVLLGAIGGAIYLVERIFGITILPAKSRGG